MGSHPAWVCGLKLINGVTGYFKCVTPCVGVWIETWHSGELEEHIRVTPCVGVWIETKKL